jgi:hypothetical protein
MGTRRLARCSLACRSKRPNPTDRLTYQAGVTAIGRRSSKLRLRARATERGRSTGSRLAASAERDTERRRRRHRARAETTEQELARYAVGLGLLDWTPGGWS